MDDLTNFMKGGSGGPAELDWLDVDEKQYRELDKLPKQNLDVVPDLKAIWRHQDEPASNFVPNTGGPRTMGDMSQSHGALRSGGPEDLTRTARMVIMQSADPMRIKSALDSRYDLTTLQANRTALSSVLAERGLLGGYYIDATDFPTCATGSKKASEFVRRFANKARFLKAKTACGDCVHRKSTVSGDHCSVFHKEIVLEVPYSDELAEAVEEGNGIGKQSAYRAQYTWTKQKDGSFTTIAKDVVLKRVGKKWEIKVKGKVKGDASTLLAAKEEAEKLTKAHLGKPRGKTRVAARARIKAALLSANGLSTQFTGRQAAPKQVAATVNTQQGLIALSNLTKKRDEAQVKKMAEIQARPVIALLRREMLKGRNRVELNQALKLAFDPRDLEATKEVWGPVYKEAGLYGVIYTTQSSFDDCRVGADFLSKHSSKTRAIVKGSKCDSCIFSKVGRCMMYGKKLVASTETVLTPATVAAVLDEHRMAGNLPLGAEKMQWGKTAREALQKLHDVAMGPKRAPTANVRSTIEQAFYGQATRDASTTNELVKRDVLKVAAQFMNEGLYGDDLLTLLRGRFLDADLQATAEALKPVLAEQGLQGIKFIDPTVYDDYGHGCKTAGAKHRTRAAVKYVKSGDKCASCVHHTRPGFCSVLSKQLVVEPPYVDKQAEQAAMLASGNSSEVSYESLMNNGLSMMQEYQLQNHEAALDINPEPESAETIIEFGAHAIKL